ncbi:FAD-dependent oxidoreductase [Corallococcus praedator]|uniref:FAD-dependent oxidoreductase n=1 Tax=Corallococcus praedator TaxID=2316724 RepID=A0ABX9QEG7_9BACT|nr:MULTISPECIES: FAD-dependent oxidoreductase [Corallococcus]RKH12963.1 FAD-dependent oxidoreductase [Corallococcus sp. CA047B]RKH24834.1 FAD-dependent oxidoreductase [Corallococcus sp. CA031C]RKI00980.1 FAD-dependent oxidoreductase [Corallococcus praedator]
MPDVIVVGGGIAGLTAAHELVERGFKVHVFDSRATWGGKARSQPVPGTGTGNRRALPGEHGFRFYPRFYRHVIDQMQRTPAAGAPGRTVDQHLKATTESAIALIDEDTWFRFSRRRLDKPYEVLEALELFFQKLDFEPTDGGLFGLKMLQFLSSSDERRMGQYEKLSWWDYTQGDRYSAKFQRQLRAVPRTMVAMDPRRGSARTLGTITMQLLLDFASSGVNNDRTMGGPTSQMWLEPWVTHLRGLGVQFHAGVRFTGFDVSEGRISRARFDQGGPRTADHYVLAVPVEAAHALITPELAALDPALARLRQADVEQLVAWMVGIQFFLYEDVPLVRGHIFYPDSPWALTSISQPQFWRELGLFRGQFGDGQVGGLLSVDISDWDTPGTFVPKRAKDCSPEEIKTEVWGQLKAALNGGDVVEQVLTDALLHSFHLDADLDYSAGLPPANPSRLLVHPPRSWEARPEAASAIPNLCLAGDYVRTHTDLATMEGACEGGRRAANAILDRVGSRAPRADIWPLTEPSELEPWKRLDAALYQKGQPHLFELLGLKTAYQAADTLRRFSAFTGLSELDDWMDQLRVTAVVDSLLKRIGAR